MTLKPMPSATGMWQDMDRQHPVTEEGQPVAYWEAPPMGQVLISPKRSQRPTACKWNDMWGVKLRDHYEGGYVGMQVKP
jgi:hypothetical protein